MESVVCSRSDTTASFLAERIATSHHTSVSTGNVVMLSSVRYDCAGGCDAYIKLGMLKKYSGYMCGINQRWTVKLSKNIPDVQVFVFSVCRNLRLWLHCCRFIIFSVKCFKELSGTFWSCFSARNGLFSHQMWDIVENTRAVKSQGVCCLWFELLCRPTMKCDSPRWVKFSATSRIKTKQEPRCSACQQSVTSSSSIYLGQTG